MTSAQVLEIFQKCGALLHGHFVLRSGKHSREFFQCALVLQEPTATAKLCQALVEKVEKEKWTFSSVISPAMGGILVGHEVARHLGKRHIFAEKEEGKLRIRRFTVSRGERFLVAEDVITRGGRVQETIDIVTQHGGIVQAVGVLVNRSGGKAKFDCPMVSLLDIEPVTWEPAECPLCKKGLPLVHPGS